MSDLLFDRARHVALDHRPWSTDFALETANQIFDFLLSGFDAEKFWPSSPEESEAGFINKSLYFGALGTMWALTRLSKRLNRDLTFEPARLIEKIHAAYLAKPDTGAAVPSYFLGESTILLLKQLLDPSRETYLKLCAVIRENSRNPVNEALWGCAGTMIAALRIGEVEGFQKSAEYLFETWIQRPDGFYSWTQDMYGQQSQYVGAGHGFFGNVYPMLEGLEHLSEEHRGLVLGRIKHVAVGCALRENGKANWRPHFGDAGKKMLVQWCHGAPGIITSLRSFPKDFSEEIESILREAGELVWQAGPLAKGIGLCHGTDGNGYALLRLHERTGDPLWLDRARAFAMHAAGRRNGRYGLWTGEAGLGLFLIDAVDASADLPSLDYV